MVNVMNPSKDCSLRREHTIQATTEYVSIYLEPSTLSKKINPSSKFFTYYNKKYIRGVRYHQHFHTTNRMEIVLT